MSGLTDEVVEEGHEFLDRVESEESQTHDEGHPRMPGVSSREGPMQRAGGESSDQAPSSKQSGQRSKLDAVKEALKIKK